MLSRIVEYFAMVEKLPIEIADISHFLELHGVADRIEFYGVDRDPDLFLGTFCKRAWHPIPDGFPEFTSWVVYNSNLPFDWERWIACKELIHILEAEPEWTSTIEDVGDLVDGLIELQGNGQNASVLNIVGIDLFAWIPAVGILFPEAARTKALNAIANGSATVEDIAKWAVLPKSMVQTVLRDNWPSVLRSVIEGR